MKLHRLGLLAIFCLQSLSYVVPANILGMFLTHSPSHVIVHMGVVRALVDRGHNVTVITSMPKNDQSSGYRHIFLKNLDHTQEETFKMMDEINRAPFYQKPAKWFGVFKMMIDKYASYEHDPDFIRFKEENNHFDLMILGYQYNDFNLGVAAHFKCPTVVSWMMQPFGHISRLIGNPTHPAFVPFSPFIAPTRMDFFDRVLNFIVHVGERIFTAGAELVLEILYNRNYPPAKYPSFKEMQDNISLILFNHHFSEGPVRPLVPALIEIGGIQIKDKPDPLPKDIEQFLEDSPQGVIYFSLGSNACGMHVKERTFKMIYDVFSSLPYNILWKFDEKEPSGNASNILSKKWLPQDDILAHKNVILFVTHAGKGGVTESEYHQVPMVALPIMDDQPSNARTMQAKGHGLVLDHETMTAEMFRNAVFEVIQNETYRNTVQRFSRLYKDRPLTARENAVFWIEYVIRHRGAPHMQSPLKALNIFQQNSIDVIFFLIAILYFCFKLIKFFLRFIKKICFGSHRKSEIKED